MEEPINFDTFAENYEELLNSQLKLFDEHEYFSEYKIKFLSQIFKHQAKKILEYGCGVGANLKWISSYFPYASLTGCDISKKSLDIAKKKFPTINFFSLEEDTSQLFDLIFSANVFHHIPVSERVKTIQTIYKKLSPGGYFVIFEHNPYNPVTRYLVNTCIFDKDAVLLTVNETKKLLKTTHFLNITHKYILFFPKILKKLRFVEPYLSWMPLGGQYCIVARKDESDSDFNDLKG